MPSMGYKKLTKSLAKKGVDDPKALAAWIGRKKFGKKTFQEAAKKGVSVKTLKKGKK